MSRVRGIILALGFGLVGLPALAQQAVSTASPTTLATPGLNLDPTLVGLLNRVDQTSDVAIAEAREAAAKALTVAAGAKLRPSLDGTGQVVLSGQQNGQGGTMSSNAGQVSLGLSARQSLDLAGSEKARIQASQDRARAAIADIENTRRLTRLTISKLFVSIRTAQLQRAAAVQGLETAADSLVLAKARAQAGLENGLGVSQATTARDRAASLIPALTSAETSQRLALEAALGLQPGALAETLAQPSPTPVLNSAALLVAPVASIANRADVKAAQARAEAAAADARGDHRDRWPTITLQALFNRTLDSGRLLGTPSVSSSSDLLAPLFDFGRRKAIAQAGDANALVADRQFKQTVIDALSSVETAYARTRLARDTTGEKSALLASARDEARLARARYTSGLTGFLDVLTAERAVSDAENDFVVAEGAEGQAALELLGAIGGLS